MSEPKECQFCNEPAQTKREGRAFGLYCLFHAGWYQGVISVATLESRKNPGHRLAIEGLPFEESLIPHATKLGGSDAPRQTTSAPGPAESNEG